MAEIRIGKRPPRYKLILNPHEDIRLSKCPICERPTHPRKFALFLHVEGWGPLILGKTCRYCTPCELVIVHHDELEAELVQCFTRLDPKVIGNDYLIVGTVDRRFWKAGLAGRKNTLDEGLEHMADFKTVLDLEYEPGGWVYDPEAAQRQRESRRRRD